MMHIVVVHLHKYENLSYLALMALLPPYAPSLYMHAVRNTLERACILDPNPFPPNHALKRDKPFSRFPDIEQEALLKPPAESQPFIILSPTFNG
jgi:hypothetical protein